MPIADIVAEVAKESGKKNLRRTRGRTGLVARSGGEQFWADRLTGKAHDRLAA